MVSYLQVTFFLFLNVGKFVIKQSLLLNVYTTQFVFFQMHIVTISTYELSYASSCAHMDGVGEQFSLLSHWPLFPLVSFIESDHSY